MSLKHANSVALLAWTTGAGVVIGTNVDISTINIGSVATTVSIYSGSTKCMEFTSSLGMYPPVALPNGPITATSSGGSFSIGYVPR